MGNARRFCELLCHGLALQSNGSIVGTHLSSHLERLPVHLKPARAAPEVLVIRIVAVPNTRVVQFAIRWIGINTALCPPDIPFRPRIRNGRIRGPNVLVVDVNGDPSHLGIVSMIAARG